MIMHSIGHHSGVSLPIADIGEQISPALSLYRCLPMDSSTSFPGGFLITVRPERNTYGAWIACLNISSNGQTVLEARPQTIQPEWTTEDEAIRDAIEWGRRYIDREFGQQQPRSWVVVRSRTEQWFQGVEDRKDH